MYMRFKLTDIHGIEVNVEVAREDDVLINTNHKYVPLNEAIISMLDKDMVSEWVEMQSNITPEDLGFDVDDYRDDPDPEDIDGDLYWHECGQYNRELLIAEMQSKGYTVTKPGE